MSEELVYPERPNHGYYNYQCNQCERFFYTSFWQDVIDAQGEFGLECRQCIELNNSIAFEVLYSDLEVI